MKDDAYDEGGQKPPLAVTSKAFVGVEQVVSIAIGVFLTIAAVAALAGAAIALWNGLVHWTGGAAVFEVVDQLLFVLMLVEILHTVRRSIESHELACEPFLIVGLIATVRRILVVTLQSSDTGLKGGAPPPPFDHTMIELGVLAALTLVLIGSIYIARKSGGAAA
jgi:uncharacterized membrane protein (DUF373 family)